MKAERIKLNGCYRLKQLVADTCVQKNGSPFTSLDVTITGIKYPAGRKRAWYFDAVGNAYRAEDFEKAVEVIAVEV